MEGSLGHEVENRPFAKKTLQVFRAQLILHDKVREVFEGSLRLARESGYLKRREMRLALDTTHIFGRGAVKDTWNLLSDGIVKLMRALSAVERTDLKEWAASRGYRRYTGSSIKRDAGIDWSDHKAREALLLEIVSDANRLLELARRMQDKLPEECDECGDIVAAAELLGRLLLQDVERRDDGVGLSDGVASDRTLSVNDPEMRHGHKSSSRRFDGHKAAVAVDTDSQLITAVDVLPGNAWDSTGALELVERSEAGTGVAASETVGDTAYGDGQTRQAFADVGRQLVARMPGRPRRTHFAKEDFLIDVEADTWTCPAGNVAARSRAWGTQIDRASRNYRLRGFRFDAAVCRACPLRDGCVAGKSGAGRTVQLGIRQARYIGRVKTKFQLYMAATVANLTLLAGRGLPVPPAPALEAQSAILLSFAPATSQLSFCWRPPFNRNLSSIPRIFGQVSRSGALSWPPVRFIGSTSECDNGVGLWRESWCMLLVNGVK